MFDVRDYPQVYLVDSNANAERLIFKQNTHSMLELIAQIAHGKGKKTYNIFSQQQPFRGPLNRLLELKSRFRRLILDDPLFGTMLLVLNILFLFFAWKFSSHIVDFIYKIIFGSVIVEEMDSSKRSQ